MHIDVAVRAVLSRSFPLPPVFVGTTFGGAALSVSVRTLGMNGPCEDRLGDEGSTFVDVECEEITKGGEVVVSSITLPAPLQRRDIEKLVDEGRMMVALRVSEILPEVVDKKELRQVFIDRMLSCDSESGCKEAGF